MARGAHIGRTPLGYQRRPDGTLEPSPSAPHVSEAYRLAASGSLLSAAQYLRRHVPGRRWEATHVRRLLASRTYLGEVRYGQLLQTEAHEPLVSRAIWEAAQTSPAERQANQQFPLSGFLQCATCRNPMVGGRGGKGQRIYRCSATLTTHGGDRCAQGAVVTADLIEPHVRELGRRLLDGMTAVVGEPDRDRLVLLERRMVEAEAELNAFAGDLMARRVLGERYHQHLQARADAFEQAQATYREQAQQARPSFSLDLAEDENMLLAVLGGVGISLLVRPGRGSIGSRVVVDERDRGGGVAASEDG